MPPTKKKECECTRRKVSRHGCPDSIALGITPGVFNTIGGWPEEPAQRLVGGMGRMDTLHFHVPRVIVRAMIRSGLITKQGVTHVTITETGRELQVRIRATWHWDRTS